MDGLLAIITTCERASGAELYRGFMETITGPNKSVRSDIVVPASKWPLGQRISATVPCSV